MSGRKRKKRDTCLNCGRKIRAPWLSTYCLPCLVEFNLYANRWDRAAARERKRVMTSERKGRKRG